MARSANRLCSPDPSCPEAFVGWVRAGVGVIAIYDLRFCDLFTAIFADFFTNYDKLGRKSLIFVGVILDQQPTDVQFYVDRFTTILLP